MIRRQLSIGICRLHRDQRGQVALLAVFYFLLLAGLVFLVLNAGHKANQKIATQNTADAATATGANWYCRSLNTIAMSNVTQTQLLSVIVLLDSLEEVTPAAKQIIDELLENIESSTHGSDVPNNPVLEDWLIVQNARDEQRMLQRLSDLVADIPMDHYCRYSDGVLWQCCFVLNELATQMALIAPEMAQREAVAVGEANRAEAAFVLPLLAELPIEDIDNTGRHFRWFRRPMRDARRVHGHEHIGGYRHIQGYASRRNGRTLGPFRYMREPFVEPTPMGLLELSRFSVLMQDVSDKKFEMLFGAPDQSAALDPASRIEEYDRLMEFVQENGQAAVFSTAWSIANFDSRYEYDTPMFEANVELRHRRFPRQRLRVWNEFQGAPAGFNRATDQGEGADARHDLWWRSRERSRAHYPQLGIYAPHPPTHANGQDWPYSEGERTPYYHNTLWRFNGAVVGPQRPLNRSYLPPPCCPPALGPIVLDRRRGQETERNVFDHFTFVGFAYVPGSSLAWPGVFVNPVPTEGRLICYAQAKVHNDTSWDLFTQNWRATLVRMNHWGWAQSEIEAGKWPAAADLTAEQIQPVRSMLEMYEPWQAELITH